MASGAQPKAASENPDPTQAISALKAQVAASDRRGPTSSESSISATPSAPDTRPADPLASVPDHASSAADYDDSTPISPASAPATDATPATDASDVPASEAPASAASSLIQARNQLRSRMKRQTSQTESGAKKARQTPAKSDALSVLDRVATAAESTSPVSDANSVATSTATPSEPVPARQRDTSLAATEPYQWRPSQPQAKAPATASSLTPKALKQALEHEKTPAMRDKLVQETNQQDPWCALADSLEVERLVKQMALNAAMVREGDQVRLTLRPDQSHLNTEKAQQQLTQALTTALGAPITLEVQLGTSGITPLERREHLYQQKLAQATHSLHNDPNVTFMLQRFAAELEEDSIRPI
jgi:DNA polymerase III tau subunit V interacting with alpha./DNA polymerase III subunits tau domain IV DnaB-binding.